jgi:hypothetical protein
VNGAGQTGLTLVVGALAGSFNQGDIITISGVDSVNRITKQDTGALRNFTVTAPAAAGSTTISIYPAIVPPTGTGQTQYQTVTASPANGATISYAGLLTANQSYRKNFAFCPEAITMATADLELPRGVHEAAREEFDGVSMRMVTQYNIATDQFITRMDVLFGFLYIRPEWAVVIADLNTPN